ncbi:MAG: EamA family transporter [candidate division FCPU426 bacterium]
MLNSGYFYLVIIYIVWGTTYLAMRVGVGPGSGFPVFSFGAARCLAAAGLLFLIARLRSQRISLSRRELGFLAATGIGMWVMAHGLVLVAEQYIASGFAAVAVSTSPIWVLLFTAWMHKTRPDWRQGLFVLVGFLGVVSLIYPELRHSSFHGTFSVVLLVVAPICWAVSSLVVRRYPQRLSTFTVSAYQHLFGGLGFGILSLLSREPWPAPTPAAWTALGFLVVFGSVIAFTSFIKALSLLPTQVVTTNTYVNPIIAVILGALILREQVTVWTLAAMVLVGLSVAGVIRSQSGTSPG